MEVRKNILCPKCGSMHGYKFKHKEPVLLRCPSCGKAVTVIYCLPEDEEVGEWVPVIESQEELRIYNDALKNYEDHSQYYSVRRSVFAE